MLPQGPMHEWSICLNKVRMISPSSGSLAATLLMHGNVTRFRCSFAYLALATVEFLRYSSDALSIASLYVLAVCVSTTSLGFGLGT